MNIDTEVKFIIMMPGPRPPYYRVADHLWGKGSNIDSDGNSSNPEDTSWTELTLCSRDEDSPCVHVDPISMDPLVLEVRSNSYEFAKRAAEYLSNETGGCMENVSA